MTVNGAWVGLLAVAVFGLCIGMAWRGSKRDVLAQIRESRIPPQPFRDWEAYHFGPAHAEHIERVERNLVASLKGELS